MKETLFADIINRFRIRPNYNLYAAHVKIICPFWLAGSLSLIKILASIIYYYFNHFSSIPAAQWEIERK